MDLPLPPMGRYTDPDLAISLDVPEGWTVTKNGAFPLQLFAPLELDYRTSLAIAVTHLDPPTEEHFDELMRSLYFEGGLELEEFELIQTERTHLDTAPAFLAHYEWYAAELDAHFSQVDAMILAGPARFYKMHGYSLKRLEVKYVPLLLHMVTSVSFGGE